MTQLILILSTGFALFFSLIALGVAYVTSKKKPPISASETLISQYRRDVAEIAGSVADLEERFTRFQKKEGMRAARSAKEKDADCKQEALDIIAGLDMEKDARPMPGGGRIKGGKQGLYKNLRGH